MDRRNPASIWGLIAVPALITLAITILRLAGELRHWPSPWFNAAAGGGGAVIGISWLPLILGPYFAVKLIGQGDAPSGTGRALGFSFLGLGLFVVSMVWAGSTFAHPSYLTLVPLALTLVVAFVPGIGWRTLGNSLVAYAFAARVPVLVVMYLAMRGNGGQGWGTHYDAIAPVFAHSSFFKKYLYEAFVPQMTIWIGWTVCVGTVFGAVTAALMRPGKQAVPVTGS